jgi:flagellar biosynthetic protein FliO
MGAGATAELPSLGGSIALSFVSLGLVCLLAYVALRWLARRGVGQAAGPLKVLARCPLEPRRSVYLIEAAGRCFLVGVGDGPMALLAEVDAKAVNADAGIPAPRFGDVFSRALARGAAAVRRAPGSPPSASASASPSVSGEEG